MNAQGWNIREKLYKQAQARTASWQNLLSFARQHKPERVHRFAQTILLSTLALRRLRPAHAQFVSFAYQIRSPSATEMLHCDLSDRGPACELRRSE